MQVFVSYEISDIFNFIISLLSAIGTIAAVWVAILANKKSNQQLVSALKIQEQAKNIDLFDKRLELIDNITQYGKAPLRELKLLFNSDSKIIKKYMQLSNIKKEIKSAEADLYSFQQMAKKKDGVGGFSSEIEDTITNYRVQISQADCPDTVVKEYIDYCNLNSFLSTDEDTGTIKELNYNEILSRLENSEDKYDKQKAELLAMLEKFVEESIKPLVNN